MILVVNYGINVEIYERGSDKLIRFKMDVAKELKDKGYIKQAAKQQGITWRLFECFENKSTPKTWHSIGAVCKMLKCQPGDFMGYMADTETLYFYFDVIDLLHKKGFTNSEAEKNGLSSAVRMQIYRKEIPASWKPIQTLCRLLECTPSSLLEWVPDKSK